MVRGRVFDVAVDIRRGSPYFGRWVGAELGPGEALWIPPGFAHGLQSLEETHFLYLVTKEYDPQRDRCIKWDDPTIAVRWPAPDKAILGQKIAKTEYYETPRRHPCAKHRKITLYYTQKGHKTVVQEY